MLNKVYEVSYAGTLHTLILDLLTQQANFPAVPQEQVYQLIKAAISDYYSANGLGDLNFPSQTQLFAHLERVTAKQEYLQELLNEMVQSQELTEIQHSYATQLLSIVLDQEPPSPFTAYGRIVELEQTMAQDLNLPFVASIPMATAAAIARESYRYWYDAKFNPENPYFPVDDNPQQRIPKWVLVIAVDCIGGLVGGAVGSTFGPGGAVGFGTAVGSAASGAVGGGV